MSQSEANTGCPAWLILRSLNPSPKGSVDFEYRDELKGGPVESRNQADFELPGKEEWGKDPEADGASCPQTSLTPPQAQPGLPDS